MESGASAESAGVGNEGVVGISLFMGGDSTSELGGGADRGPRLSARPASMLQQEFSRGGLMQGLLLRYTQALMTADDPDRGLQPASLGGATTVPLAAADPRPDAVAGPGHDPATGGQHARRAPRRHHRAAGDLQQAGFIRYRRGHITVLDRVGLEGRACECYAIAKKELHRLLVGRAIPAGGCHERWWEQSRLGRQDGLSLPTCISSSGHLTAVTYPLHADYIQYSANFFRLPPPHMWGIELNGPATWKYFLYPVIRWQ